MYVENSTPPYHHERTLQYILPQQKQQHNENCIDVLDYLIKATKKKKIKFLVVYLFVVQFDISFTLSLSMNVQNRKKKHQ